MSDTERARAIAVDLEQENAALRAALNAALPDRCPACDHPTTAVDRDGFCTQVVLGRWGRHYCGCSRLLRPQRTA